MKHIQREQFIWEFNRIGKIPTIYKFINFNTKTYINKDNSINSNTSKVITTSLIPTFLSTYIYNEDQYKVKKIIHKNYSGAGIALEHPETIEGFMNNHLKPQIKKNLRRTISRLEESFNITYKYYYGSITKEEFDFLLNTLKGFLTKRFNQKKILNHFLNEWNKNIDGLFELINQKKASFIVVYDNHKPISISLNRHIEKSILHSECNGYDLDYSKFGLGHLDNYLVLKWCIENKFDFLDLGIGVLEYKQKWCNTYYDFEYHVYSQKNSIIANIIAFKEINKIKAKNLLKQLKIDVYLKRLKSVLRKKEINNDIFGISYILEELESLNDYESDNLKKLNIDLPETEGIRQSIYDYLYTNKGHIDNIEIYKISTELNTYVFKAENTIIKITLN